MEGVEEHGSAPQESCQVGEDCNDGLSDEQLKLFGEGSFAASSPARGGDDEPSTSISPDLEMELFGEHGADASASAQVEETWDFDLDNLTSEDMAKLFGTDPPAASPKQQERKAPGLALPPAASPNQPHTESSGLALPPPPPPLQPKAKSPALPAPPLSGKDPQPEPKKRRPAQARERRADKLAHRAEAQGVSAPPTETAPANARKPRAKKPANGDAAQIFSVLETVVAPALPATYRFEDHFTPEMRLEILSWGPFQEDRLTPEGRRVLDELCVMYNLPRSRKSSGTANNPIAVDDEKENVALPGSAVEAPINIGDDNTTAPAKEPTPPPAPAKRRNGDALFFKPADGSDRFTAPPRAPEGRMAHLAQVNPQGFRAWMFGQQAVPSA